MLQMNPYLKVVLPFYKNKKLAASESLSNTFLKKTVRMIQALQ